MAGLPSGSGTPTSLASLHPGSQPPLLHGASSREQAELLQRELYSRAYMDPTLAHQVPVTVSLVTPAWTYQVPITVPLVTPTWTPPWHTPDSQHCFSCHTYIDPTLAHTRYCLLYTSDAADER